MRCREEGRRGPQLPNNAERHKPGDPPDSDIVGGDAPYNNDATN